jgi:murein DD-endopeptidase MepM/ murein hydrolase activator NlpD
MKFVRFALIILFIISCSSVPSGIYIKLSQKDTVATLSKKYSTPKWALLEANEGKSWKPGSWVFVPQRKGFMGQDLGHKSVASITRGALGNGDFLWPVPSGRRISSHFGKRWGRHHDGIDIPARRGAHIVASAGGVVAYAGNEIGGYGNIVVIGHPKGFFTIYAHADKLYVKTNQKVHQGQVIATVGSTGRSTGNHLHFEIRYDSKAINPKKLMKLTSK